MDMLVLPALHRFKPDVIIIACGFDAGAFDPLGRMFASADTFRQMTRHVMAAADDLCHGRLMMAHEGGYSEVYVPFCGHAVLEEMSAAPMMAPDPYADTLHKRQPDARFDAYLAGLLLEQAQAAGLTP
jgi:acetoin utilization deacetylase AcuC-like enzyme